MQTIAEYAADEENFDIEQCEPRKWRAFGKGGVEIFFMCNEDDKIQIEDILKNDGRVLGDDDDEKNNADIFWGKVEEVIYNYGVII